MKRLVLLVVCSMFLVSNVGTAFAADIQKANKPKGDKQQTVKVVNADDGRKVNITISESVGDKVSNEELTSIANSNTDTDNITILEVGYAKKLTASVEGDDLGMRSILGITYFTWPEKIYNSYDVFESDRFMASCAKGETKTVSRTITEKLTAKITGTIKVGSLDVNNEISYSLTEGQTIVGPPENSSYNSREYRCKFYQNKGIWSQIVCINDIYFYPNGTFTEPSKYISYSKDTYQ